MLALVHSDGSVSESLNAPGDDILDATLLHYRRCGRPVVQVLTTDSEDFEMHRHAPGNTVMAFNAVTSKFESYRVDVEDGEEVGRELLATYDPVVVWSAEEAQP